MRLSLQSQRARNNEELTTIGKSPLSLAAMVDIVIINVDRPCIVALMD